MPTRFEPRRDSLNRNSRPRLQPQPRPWLRQLPSRRQSPRPAPAKPAAAEPAKPPATARPAVTNAARPATTARPSRRRCAETRASRRAGASADGECRSRQVGRRAGAKTGARCGCAAGFGAASERGGREPGAFRPTVFATPKSAEQGFLAHQPAGSVWGNRKDAFASSASAPAVRLRRDPAGCRARGQTAVPAARYAYKSFAKPSPGNVSEAERAIAQAARRSRPNACPRRFKLIGARSNWTRPRTTAGSTSA